MSGLYDGSHSPDNFTNVMSGMTQHVNPEQYSKMLPLQFKHPIHMQVAKQGGI